MRIWSSFRPWMNVFLGAALLAVALPLDAATPSAEIVGLAGKCLSVQGGSTAEGAAVVLQGCAGAAGQRWDLAARGFTAELVGLGGKCLDAESGIAVLRSCDGRPTQGWRFGQDGRIVGDGGLCLDVLGSNTAELAPVGVAGCDGKANQLWRPRKENQFTLTALVGDAHVTRFWVDPGGSDVAYALLSSSGLFRSEDGGESWSPLVESLGDVPFDLTVSPADAGVLYVSGRASRDGGLSWQEMKRPPRGIAWLAPDPQTPHEVFALTARGDVYQSRDTARSWTKLSRVPVPPYLGGRLVVHPAQPRTLFASSNRGCDALPCGQSEGSFRSTDGGRRWQPMLAGGRFFFRKLEFDRTDPRRIFALTFQQVLRSDDGGTSWSDVTPPGATPTSSLIDLVVDPDRPARLLASSGGRLYTSSNRGDSWTATGFRIPARAFFTLWSSTADGERVFASLDDFSGQPEASPSGLYVSDDWGKNWRRLGRGLATASFQAATMTTNPGGRTYALGDSGLFATADGGTSWRQLLTGGRFALALDPADPDHLLVSSGRNRVVRSTDGGKTFASRARGIDDMFVYALGFRPGAPGTAYALGSSPDASSGSLYRTRNNGGRWESVLEVPLFSYLLAIDSDGRQVYVGTESGLEISADDGDTWQSQPMEVFELATDRTRAGEVWVFTDDGLLLSEDRGASWREIQPPPPLTFFESLAVTSLDAAFGEVIVTLNYFEGVWRSSDRGASWTRLDPDWVQEVYPLATADPRQPGRVWLATFGLGVLVGDFSD